MEEIDPELRKSSKDIPKVPIKTYRWEDVKRSRRRGAYPWTHLNKPPLDDDFDPDEYTMDAFRSKSTSTLGKSEPEDYAGSDVNLQDDKNDFLSDTESRSSLPQKAMASSEEAFKTSTLPLPQASANVSKTVKAQSEEPRSKRKLSADSSHSKRSLPKLSLKEKLQSTKNKLQIPTLMKRSKSDASDKKKPKKHKSSTNVKTPSTAQDSKKLKTPRLATVKDESPVYIHIPLKLPPGEMDEFSKYEFDSPAAAGSRSDSLNKLDKIVTERRKMSLLGLLTELKKVQEEKERLAKLAAQPPKAPTPVRIQQGDSIRIRLKDDSDDDLQDSKNEDTKLEDEAGPTEKPEHIEAKRDIKTDETAEPTVELLDSIDSTVINVKDHNLLDIQELDEDKKSTKSSELETSQKSAEPIVFEPEDSSADDNISQYLDKDDNVEIISEKSTNVSSDNISQSGASKKEDAIQQSTSQPKVETTVKKLPTVENTISKWKKLPPTSSTLSPTPQKQRAKSEEPKRKRRLSVDSSYSRKSLSKLAFVKRFKEATSKIKLPKFPSFKKPAKEVKNTKPKASAEPAVKKPPSGKSLAVKPPENPVYIHIPLKLPSGKTDEFSHLAEEPREQKEPSVKKELHKEPDSFDNPDTPPPGDDVQLIYLTAPSDDELLDANIPETPSETDKKFFESLKVDDLKDLAKDVVNKIYPEPKALETVKENEEKEESVSGVLKLQIAPKNDTQVEASIQEEVKSPPEADESVEKSKTDDSPKEESAKPEPKPEPEKVEKIKPVVQSKPSLRHQILIDEEDGLKLSDAAIAMINEEMEKIQNEKELEQKEQELKIQNEKELAQKEEELKIQKEKELAQKEEELKIQKEKELAQREEELKIQNQKKLAQKEEELKIQKEKELAQKEEELKIQKEKELEEKMHDLKIQGETELEPEVLESPILKKKVSFKRRSKTDNGERIYEDLELSAASGKNKIVNENQKVQLLESSPSMSVEEEKSYLDKNIIKATSLDEDYNKWSILNDHEYEPVNPPPENTIAPPTNYIHISLHAPKEIETKKNLSPILKTKASTTQQPNDKSNIQEAQNIFDKEPISKEKDNKNNQLKSSTSKQTKSVTETKKDSAPPKESGFNIAIRNQADKIKAKFQNIKKSGIKLPPAPKFPSTKIKKPQFKKPNFTMPKMPKRPSLNLPSLGFTRKDSWKTRQLSTESNVSDSQPKIFDFRTYPRIFDKHKKNKPEATSESTRSESPPLQSEFATVPRVTKRTKRQEPKAEDSRKSKDLKYHETKDFIRIPLHSDDEIDTPSHTRYNEDIDMEDDLDRDNLDIRNDPEFNNEFLRRWDHGEFHEHPQQQRKLEEHDLNADNLRPYSSDVDTSPGRNIESSDREFSRDKEVHSSGSLHGRRQGVLEEIDSDEFFLREKGISQENIEVGKYLSSEIREAFRNPINTLHQFQSEDREYDLSDQSEPVQVAPKRKPLKKPKRKKTPHVSKEQISFDQESVTTEPGELTKPMGEFIPVTPPSRPKRKSKSIKKKKPKIEDVVPFRETIAIEESFQYDVPRVPPQHVPEETAVYIFEETDPNIIMMYENDLQQIMYENEFMQGIEQPDIHVSESYDKYEKFQDFQEEIDGFLHADEEAPVAPKRKQRSLKSLTVSDIDSNTDIEGSRPAIEQTIEDFRAEEYIIPTPEPPKRSRRFRSPTNSHSGISQQEDDGTSRGAESLVSDAVVEVEVIEIIEEPCVQQTCDPMGYAVVSKSKIADPPLPPCRYAATPPARKKRKNKFSTVPRSSNNDVPRRPLRNYSTLNSMNGSCRNRSTGNVHDDDKENVDIRQYIEIEDEDPVRRLQSGEVIKKMKGRPLPAPPRPPRKSKTPVRGALRDISHERNIPTESQSDLDKILSDNKSYLETQSLTEFYHSQDQDISFLSNIENQIEEFDREETITHGSLVIQPLDNAQLIPEHEMFTNSQNASAERLIPIQQEERHETFVQNESVVPAPLSEVSPLEESKNLPVMQQDQLIQQEDEEFSEIPEEFVKLKDPPSKQPAQQEQPVDLVDYEESSEIPEEFTKLKSPSVTRQSNEKKELQSQEKIRDKPTVISIPDDKEINLLKATNLQVANLDIDKLRVNELQANKIVVSELDGVSLHVSEINSKSGNLVISGIELPPQLISQMLDQLQVAAAQNLSPSQQQGEPLASSSADPDNTESETIVEKKTSFEQIEDEIDDTVNFPVVPPRYDSQSDLLDEGLIESTQIEENITMISDALEENSATADPPIRPPRKSIQIEKSQNLEETIEIPEETSRIFHIFQNSEAEIEDLPELQPGQESLNSLPQTESSKSEEEPPPRPPQPLTEEDLSYMPSQPPLTFYSLRSPPFIEFIEEDIPLAPRRKRHHKSAPRSRSKSSSDESVPVTRRHRRSPEPSIPQLTGQLVRACATETERSVKRLISDFSNNVLKNADGRQDSYVMILILLIMIAGLILLSCDEKIMVHHHHWEYFNPPKDL